MLINSYEERRSRNRAKWATILRFLRDETWSNLANLKIVANLSEPATFKTLQQMERDKMLRHKVHDLRLSLWGITSQGLAFSWSCDEEMQPRRYFEPSKISTANIHHELDIQRVRLFGRKCRMVKLDSRSPIACPALATGCRRS